MRARTAIEEKIRREQHRLLDVLRYFSGREITTRIIYLAIYAWTQNALGTVAEFAAFVAEVDASAAFVVAVAAFPLAP